MNVSSLPATQKHVPDETASVTRSAFWLGTERILRLGVAFFVGVLVIRHLGPENNGLLQSGLALAAIISTVIELGLESILRRELVRRPAQAGTLLGTASVLRLVVLGPALMVFLAIYYWQTHGQQLALGCMLGVTLILPIGQVGDTWLLANGQMRGSAVANSLALTLSALLRIVLLFSTAGVMAFGAATVAETFFVLVILSLVLCSRPSVPTRWHFARSDARQLLRDATPLLFTNLAILMYRRCDLLIVTSQLHERAAGLYAAAIKLTEVGYLLPMILVNAWFPRLTKLHAEDSVRYVQELTRFYKIVTWLGIAFAAVGSLLAPWLIPLVFGRAYTETITPFIIYSWTAVFIAQGIARSQWLLLENKLGAGLILAMTGAVLNLGLNLLLIPRLGLNGAALSAVIALGLNLGVLPAFSRHTRPAWVFGWRALLLRPGQKQH